MNDRSLQDDRPLPRAKVFGGRCAQCGHFSLPQPVTCPACLSEDITADAVDGGGTVYSATVVRSGARNRQLPYGLAYVDLDAGIRVMAAYAVDDAQPLVPDQPVLVSHVGESEAGLPLLNVGVLPSLATS